MVVRDAEPTDVEDIATLTEVSEAAATRLIQERTVRVHVDDGPDGELTAFVSFDASARAVQLTHLAGAAEDYGDLLGETIRFAEGADLPIEMVVPEDEPGVRSALEKAGFATHGDGPRFQGCGTIRYRRPVETDD